jgi:small subunit ribosomal protein S16
VAVKIRLKRMGKIRAPHYRIVVADSRTKRDGRVIEEIGKYHPKEDPSFIEVNSERAQYWLGVGAQPSEPVAAILKVTGDWQKFRGEPAPAPMLVAEPRRDKNDIFNDALKDAAREPQTDAVTPRRSATRKPATLDESESIEAAVAEPEPAEAAPVTTAAAADDALAEDIPAEAAAEAEIAATDAGSTGDNDTAAQE